MLRQLRSVAATAALLLCATAVCCTAASLPARVAAMVQAAHASAASMPLSALVDPAASPRTSEEVALPSSLTADPFPCSYTAPDGAFFDFSALKTATGTTATGMASSLSPLVFLPCLHPAPLSLTRPTRPARNCLHCAAFSPVHPCTAAMAAASGTANQPLQQGWICLCYLWTSAQSCSVCKLRMTDFVPLRFAKLHDLRKEYASISSTRRAIADAAAAKVVAADELEQMFFMHHRLQWFNHWLKEVKKLSKHAAALEALLTVCPTEHTCARHPLGSPLHCAHSVCACLFLVP
jgi:hypothetical protein